MSSVRPRPHLIRFRTYRGGQQNIGGVGFLVCANEKQTPQVINFEGWPERLATLLVEFQGTRISICAAYAPTEASPSERHKGEFYKELMKAYGSLTKKSKMVLVMDDFNCRLGKDSKHLAPKMIGTGGLDRVPTSVKLLACKSGIRGLKGARCVDTPGTTRPRTRGQC